MVFKKAISRSAFQKFGSVKCLCQKTKGYSNQHNKSKNNVSRESIEALEKAKAEMIARLIGIKA